MSIWCRAEQEVDRRFGERYPSAAGFDYNASYIFPRPDAMPNGQITSGERLIARRRLNEVNA